MKAFVYGMRRYDELGYLEASFSDAAIECSWTEAFCSLDTAHLASGCEIVVTTPEPLDARLLERLHAQGARYIATRSIGYDHIDLSAARDLGFHISHVAYRPETVANYAIMLIMMGLRSLPSIMQRVALQNFLLEGTIGRDLSDCTVGIVGMGSIGSTVARHLQGFGCAVLAYDPSPSAADSFPATFRSLDTVLSCSDVVTLHAPSNADTYHLIDARALSLMKPDSLLVNTARGSLVDTDALIDALRSGHIGGAALDVLENENGLFRHDWSGATIDDRRYQALRALPNVLITPHTAFYTDTVIRQMSETTVQGIVAMIDGTPSSLVLF